MRKLELDLENRNIILNGENTGIGWPLIENESDELLYSNEDGDLIKTGSWTKVNLICELMNELILQFNLTTEEQENILNKFREEL